MGWKLENALRSLKNDTSAQINSVARDKIPNWARSEDIERAFLPFLTIYGDSREQNCWIAKACSIYGINYIKAIKTDTTENLKEGDYTFSVQFGPQVYNYTGIVVYERKGSLAELYNNYTAGRDRIEREFNRIKGKKYKKVVLLIDFANNYFDLINASFSYYESGKLVERNTQSVILNGLLSWQQPNVYNFSVLMNSKRYILFWLMVLDMYYYFRADIKEKKEKTNETNRN